MKFEFVLLKKDSTITKRKKILAGVSLLIVLPIAVKFFLLLIGVLFMALKNYQTAMSILPVMIQMQFLNLNGSYPGLASGVVTLCNSMPVYYAGAVDMLSGVLRYVYPVTRIALLILGISVIRGSKGYFKAFVITLSAIISLTFFDLLFLIGGETSHSFASAVVDVFHLTFLSAILYYLNADQVRMVDRE